MSNEELLKVIRDLLECSEGWFDTAWCEGQTDHDSFDAVPAVIAAKAAVANG